MLWFPKCDNPGEGSGLSKGTVIRGRDQVSLSAGGFVLWAVGKETDSSGENDNDKYQLLRLMVGYKNV